MDIAPPLNQANSTIVTLNDYRSKEPEHKMYLKDFTPRLYQESIFNTCTLNNTLVVLPTGIGKTAIFLMMAAYRLNLYPKSKILLLGPTRPLIEQYYSVFQKYFNIETDKMAVFTGFVSPETRRELWKKSSIIFSTPQGLENDVMSSRISLADVSLIGFDECHRSTGDYSYNFIAKQYMKKALYPRIVGLTASPGSDNEKIKEVCQNLFIEKIEVRSTEDDDVNPYVQDVDIEKIFVDLPDNFSEVKHYLDLCLKRKTSELKNYGFASKSLSYSKKNLLQLQGAIHARIAKGEKDFEVLKSMSVLAEIIKVHHAIELLETQGIEQLNEYMEKLEREAAAGKTKATQNLVKDIDFRSAHLKLRNIPESFEHPKIHKVLEIVENELSSSKKKIIIFTQYRDSGSKIVKLLNDSGFSARLFVGQAKKKDTGLSQKAQKEMIEDFSQGKFDILVSSSVGEEGLDIPQVDIVLFYEPVPSAIRKIQRSGRTGRLEKGKIIMLITRATMDEVYYHVARNKEKRMYKAITDIKNDFKLEKISNNYSAENNSGKDKDNSKVSISSNANTTLDDFKTVQDNNPQIKIIADYREKGSAVLKSLIDKEVDLSLEKLDIGDFQLSERTIVEYKNVRDFVDSIIDGRLLSQLKELNRFARPIIIVEGEEDIYAARKVHPNAIRGMLATIAVSYGVPLIQTKSPIDTAELLMIISKREQANGKFEVTHHFSKPLTLKEQQEYFISALPNIGIGGAIPLLKHFSTIKNIVNASEKELQDVNLIGPKKSKALKELFDSEWKE